MKAYFFDTSALVKRYVNETGSIWIREIVAPETGNKLFVSRITWVEVLPAKNCTDYNGFRGAL